MAAADYRTAQTLTLHRGTGLVPYVLQRAQNPSPDDGVVRWAMPGARAAGEPVRQPTSRVLALAAERGWRVEVGR